jgi:hypothetical protein
MGSAMLAPGYSTKSAAKRIGRQQSWHAAEISSGAADGSTNNYGRDNRILLSRGKNRY